MKTLIFQVFPFLLILLLLNGCSCAKENSSSQSSNSSTEIPIELDAVELNKKIVTGYVDLNGQLYNVECDCSQDEEESTQKLDECKSSKIQVTIDSEGVGLTMGDIQELIGKGIDVEYADVSTTPFKCMDGRTSGFNLYTPGGEAGEFFLGLQLYQQTFLNNIVPSVENIIFYLKEYLKIMSIETFYMCTDDLSIDHLQRALEVEGLNIFNPKEELKKQLWDQIIDTNNVGDAHMKLILKYPSKYGIKKELAQNFLTAFYSILWDQEESLRKRITLDSLIGVHDEKAFIEIRTNEGCKAAKLAPLIKGKEKEKSYFTFVNHIDAVSIRRRQIAKFFVSNIGHHSQPITEDDLYYAMEHLGAAYLDITGGYLALSLPFYTVHVI